MKKVVLIFLLVSLCPTSLSIFIQFSDLRLILVNFVVAGLEIASSVAFTFIPPLLLKSGYSETQMTIIFGVGKLPIFKKNRQIKIALLFTTYNSYFQHL